MTKYRFVRFFCIGLYLLLFLPACQEEDVATGEPSQVSFQQSAGYSNENDGIIKIPIQLDMPQNAETLVHFSLGGNAILANLNVQNPDFELLTESPLTIKKGESIAFVEIKILDDSQFEQDYENINLQLERIVSGNAVLSNDVNQLTYNHEIVENDYKLYLEWDAAQTVDLNMFIELPNKELISANNTSGFEEVTVINVKDQEQYFVDIWYQGEETLVSFELKGLNAGETEKKLLLNGSFNSDLNSKSTQNKNETNYQNYLMIKEGHNLKILY
ncbi:Calx-beta domain-containing protein [Catalinimonas sp. 4WD22]|uniref:Calx-beta domain-containing protein n=1 Tax=Catalinimonas locisalis TaxID=3133978 RepID=UPI003100DCD0